MSQIKLFFITILFPLFTLGQTKSVLIEFQIHEFVYLKDTANLILSKEIKVQKLGCTDIISIGNIKNNEFAIQIETAISLIGKTERLVVGMAFYMKKKGKWEMMRDPSYREYVFYGSSNENNFQDASHSFGDEFEIQYSERYTLIK